MKYSSDPALPCPLCVSWVGDTDDPDSIKPIHPDGTEVTEMWNGGYHHECQQMLDDYMADREGI